MPGPPTPPKSRIVRLSLVPPYCHFNIESHIELAPMYSDSNRLSGWHSRGGHTRADNRGFEKSTTLRPCGSRVVRHSLVPPYIATSTSGVTSNLHNAGSDSNQMNLPAPGVTLTGGQIKTGNLGFWKSVWPRAAGEPVKKISGYVPILFERVPGRPGRASQNPGLPVSVWSPRIATPMCKQRTSLMR